MSICNSFTFEMSQGRNGKRDTDLNSEAKLAVKIPSCRGENDPCIRPASTRLESIKLLTSIARRETFRETSWRTCFFPSLLSSLRRSDTGPWMRVSGVRSS